MNAPHFGSQNSSVIHLPSEQGSRRDISCSFESFEQKLLKLSAVETVPVSSVISVEHSDALFLGEVISCKKESDTIWKLEIRVEQILSGLNGLMALRARLLGEPTPKMATVLH